MNTDMLERRRDPRTQAFVPITLQYHDADEETPAHLLDLSCGGAGVLTTAYNAPSMGQYLELKFEKPTNEGGTESSPRQETGIVVQVKKPERGIARVSIRFLQHRGIDCDLFDPNDILTEYRRTLPPEERNRRWETARSFEGSTPSRTPVMAN